MDENLTDQQRAEQIRQWLRENGWYLLAGLVIGLGGLFGYRQWDSYGLAQAEEASAVYQELLEAIRVDRTTRAEELTAKLESEYPRTPYVDQARLAMARLKIDRARPEEAARYLEEVVEGSGSAEIVHIARLRLARVLIQEEKYDEALKTLSPPRDSAFEARFHEVRGDAYYAMGKMAEARAEYESALKGADAATADQAYLQAKLDEVVGAMPPVGDAAVTAPAPAAN